MGHGEDKVMPAKFAKRLRLARKRSGLTQEQLGEKTGITPSTISRYERNKIENIKRAIVDSIASCLEVNPSWLAGISDEDKRPKGFNDLNKAEKKLLKSFRGLSQNGQEMLQEHAQLLSLSSKYSLIGKMIQIPVCFLPASAGTGAFLDSDQYESGEFPEEVVPRESNFAVRVSGDSMEPDYPDKSVVFVKRTKTLEPGDIGVFILNGEGFLKKLGENNNLISLNEKYEDIRPNEFSDLRIVGKVVGQYIEK